MNGWIVTGQRFPGQLVTERLLLDNIFLGDKALQLRKTTKNSIFGHFHLPILATLRQELRRRQFCHNDCWQLAQPYSA